MDENWKIIYIYTHLYFHPARDLYVRGMQDTRVRSPLKAEGDFIHQDLLVIKPRALFRFFHISSEASLLGSESRRVKSVSSDQAIPRISEYHNTDTFHNTWNMPVGATSTCFWVFQGFFGGDLCLCCFLRGGGKSRQRLIWGLVYFCVFNHWKLLTEAPHTDTVEQLSVSTSAERCEDVGINSADNFKKKIHTCVLHLNCRLCLITFPSDVWVERIFSNAYF